MAEMSEKEHKERSSKIITMNWLSHNSKFNSKLSMFWEKGLYTDVTLACQGEFFQAHKLVLATCSDYFDDMFENTPCKHPVIVLNDIQPKDLDVLLRFMYKGVIRISQKEEESFMKVARLFLVKGLIVQVERPFLPINKSTNNSNNEQTSPPSKRLKCAENNQATNSPNVEDVTLFRPKPTECNLHTDNQLSNSAPEQGSTDSKAMVVVDESIIKKYNEEVTDYSIADEDDNIDHSDIEDDASFDGFPAHEPKQLKPMESLEKDTAGDFVGPSGLQKQPGVQKDDYAEYLKTVPCVVTPFDEPISLKLKRLHGTPFDEPISQKLKRLHDNKNLGYMSVPYEVKELTPKPKKGYAGSLTKKLNDILKKSASTDNLDLETYPYIMGEFLQKTPSSEDLPPPPKPDTPNEQTKTDNLKKKPAKVKNKKEKSPGPSNLDPSGEPITYSLKLGASVRGGDKLIDSLGYTYVRKRDSRRPNLITWVCSLQLKHRQCKGKVYVHHGEYKRHGEHDQCNPDLKIHKRHINNEEKNNETNKTHPETTHLDKCKKNEEKPNQTSETQTDITSTNKSMFNVEENNLTNEKQKDATDTIEQKEYVEKR